MHQGRSKLLKSTMARRSTMQSLPLFHGHLRQSYRDLGLANRPCILPEKVEKDNTDKPTYPYQHLCRVSYQGTGSTESTTLPLCTLHTPKPFMRRAIFLSRAEKYPGIQVYTLSCFWHNSAAIHGVRPRLQSRGEP